MGINRGRFVNKAKIYAAMFIVVALLVTDLMLRVHIEDGKRQQARYNLEHSIACLHDYEIAHNGVDRQAFKHCTYKQRTSTTGDMYVLDMDTMEFVYDGSTDIPVGENLYFTKESIGKYFKEWNTAVKAKRLMQSGNSSTYSTNAWYNYDGATEWVEFTTYTTMENKKYIVVQGVQEDEVLSNFHYLRMLVGMLVSGYVLWLLATSVHDRRASDECR